jgi:hypothetical protein
MPSRGEWGTKPSGGLLKGEKSPKVVATIQTINAASILSRMDFGVEVWLSRMRRAQQIEVGIMKIA